MNASSRLLGPLTDIFAATVRDVRDGTYLVIDHDARIEFLWTGANARRAHAALARVLNARGIKALDVPGMGVMVD